MCVIIHILRSLQPRHQVHGHCILEAQDVFRLGFPFMFLHHVCVHVRVGAVKDEEEDDALHAFRDVYRFSVSASFCPLKKFKCELH